MVCVDAVKRILSQPREEMNIVRLMNAEPLIREIFLKPPIKDLQSQESQDSIVEEDEDVSDDSPSEQMIVDASDGGPVGGFQDSGAIMVESN